MLAPPSPTRELLIAALTLVALLAASAPAGAAGSRITRLVVDGRKPLRGGYERRDDRIIALSRARAAYRAARAG